MSTGWPRHPQRFPDQLIWQNHNVRHSLPSFARPVTSNTRVPVFPGVVYNGRVPGSGVACRTRRDPLMIDPRTASDPPASSPDAERITPDAFLHTLARSRLVAPDRVEAVTASLQLGVSARELADALILAGDLTRYQAEKLLQGRSHGLVLGPYHVLAPLGRGGMGTVYLARITRAEEGRGARGEGQEEDTRAVSTPAAAADSPLAPRSTPQSSSLVALKILPPKKAREEEKSLLRFRREMEISQLVDHPNITRVLDTGLLAKIHYIAMEFVPGHTLRQVVGQTGPLTVAVAARVFADVAAGLAHAHGRGVIHRDIKPANIMVTPDGRAKILDLGLALVEGEARGALDPLAESEDITVIGGRGYILGTMDYIAPEQAVDARDVSPRSDLYAVGCSLYHALTGTPPFPGGKSKQKMQWHQLEEPPPIESLNPAVPPEFIRLVMWLMAKRPADRPADAETVRRLLLPWIDGTPVAIEGVTGVTEAAALAEFDHRSGDSSLWDLTPLPDDTSTEIHPAARATPSALELPTGPPPLPTRVRRSRRVNERAAEDADEDDEGAGNTALIAFVTAGIGAALLIVLLLVLLRGR